MGAIEVGRDADRWYPMKLTAISGGWLFAIALVAAAGLTGCADSPAGPGAQAEADGLLISEPVRSGAALVAGDTEGLAYIAASPGRFPDGISATITNLANGETVTVEIVDGGYDPVGLKASPYNEIEITFRNRDGSFTTLRGFVPVAKRPRIVRTRPPRDATDVVLAFSPLEVVFSEPVARSAVTRETIKLLADGAPVDVTIALGVDGLVAQLTPMADLAPHTNYTLVVTTELLDSKGDPLEARFEASFTTESAPPPVASAGAGSIHTCGLTVTGNAYCWGFNDFGQLGDGSTTGSLTPVLVSGGIRFSSISTRGGHTCGVTSVGDAYCWGENFRGQLGDGTTINRLTPVLVSGGLSFASVSTAYSETCGVTTAGDAYCWGDNFNGQLGDGTTINRLTPVPVAGGLSFASLSAGATTCGVTTTGAAYCWGRNHDQLGDGTTNRSLAPLPVAGGHSFASLSTASWHTCGLTVARDVYCWGNNGVGQLGDGTTNRSLTPVLVSGGLSFASLSAGRSNMCGVTTAGDAYCWGENWLGQLGDGTRRNRHTPVPVAGGLSFASVGAAGLHTCAVTTAGVAYCWGSNGDGQLGDGSTTDRLTPVRVVR